MLSLALKGECNFIGSVELSSSFILSKKHMKYLEGRNHAFTLQDK